MVPRFDGSNSASVEEAHIEKADSSNGRSGYTDKKLKTYFIRPELFKYAKKNISEYDELLKKNITDFNKRGPKWKLITTVSLF